MCLKRVLMCLKRVLMCLKRVLMCLKTGFNVSQTGFKNDICFHNPFERIIVLIIKQETL